MAITRSQLKTAGVAVGLIVAARWIIDRVPMFAPLRGVI